MRVLYLSRSRRRCVRACMLFLPLPCMHHTPLWFCLFVCRTLNPLNDNNLGGSKCIASQVARPNSALPKNVCNAFLVWQLRGFLRFGSYSVKTMHNCALLSMVAVGNGCMPCKLMYSHNLPSWCCVRGLYSWQYRMDVCKPDRRNAMQGWESMRGRLGTRLYSK